MESQYGLSYREFKQKLAAGFRGYFVPGVTLDKPISIEMHFPRHTAYCRIVPAANGCWFLVGRLQQDILELLGKRCLASKP